MDHSYALRSTFAVWNYTSLGSSRRLGPLLEYLQQSGPAAVDVLAHRLARLGTHLLEFAVFELDAGCVCAVGDEFHLPLGGDGRIRLPAAVDVPRHDETFGRLPHDDLADIRARSVFGQFVPMTAEAGFPDGRFSRRLVHSLVQRAPASQPPSAEVGCLGLAPL